MREIKTNIPVVEIMGERFDDALDLMTENSLIFGGAIRDTMAKLPLLGDLDIAVSQEEYSTIYNNFKNSSKWIEEGRRGRVLKQGHSDTGFPYPPVESLSKRSNYEHIPSINTVTTFTSFGNLKVQLIVSKKSSIDPLEPAIEVVKNADIICCCIAVNKNGIVYEVVPGAEEDCTKRRLRINLESNSINDFDKCIKRIKTLTKNGWKNLVNIKELERHIARNDNNNKTKHKDEKLKFVKENIKVNGNSGRICIFNQCLSIIGGIEKTVKLLREKINSEFQTKEEAVNAECAVFFSRSRGRTENEGPSLEISPSSKYSRFRKNIENIIVRTLIDNIEIPSDYEISILYEKESIEEVKRAIKEILSPTKISVVAVLPTKFLSDNVNTTYQDFTSFCKEADGNIIVRNTTYSENKLLRNRTVIMILDGVYPETIDKIIVSIKTYFDEYTSSLNTKIKNLKHQYTIFNNNSAGTVNVDVERPTLQPVRPINPHKKIGIKIPDTLRTPDQVEKQRINDALLYGEAEQVEKQRINDDLLYGEAEQDQVLERPLELKSRFRIGNVVGGEKIPMNRSVFWKIAKDASNESIEAEVVEIKKFFEVLSENHSPTLETLQTKPKSKSQSSSIDLPGDLENEHEYFFSGEKISET